MRKWLPFSLMTASLLSIWLLLTESLTPGAVVLGLAVAFGAQRALMALAPPRIRFRHLRVAVDLAAVVLREVVRSNWAVAWIVLRPGGTERVSGFVRIPLDMRAPYGLTALACIITATPGTLWVEYDTADNTMLLHVLDLIDEEEWVRIIKDRYERRLMEIFG
jgi:multicomponent K+:H+ antiporter subunit E